MHIFHVETSDRTPRPTADARRKPIFSHNLDSMATESPGKDLLRALHEAPEDMAAWLDPTTVEGKGQEGMKDERFKPLREGLVRVLAESSVSYFRRRLKSPFI